MVPYPKFFKTEKQAVLVRNNITNEWANLFCPEVDHKCITNRCVAWRSGGIEENKNPYADEVAKAQRDVGYNIKLDYVGCGHPHYVRWMLDPGGWVDIP